LPAAAVKESKDRVSTAWSNAGCKSPVSRATSNLAPAGVQQEGPGFAAW
jgi:magnesium chelatase family protein